MLVFSTLELFVVSFETGPKPPVFDFTYSLLSVLVNPSLVFTSITVAVFSSFSPP